MNPVVHFEMPYENRERVQRFYETVFGWKTQFLGSDMGNYMLVTTAESDAKSGAPAGAINGGLFPKNADSPQHPCIVIGVSNINSSMDAVARAGGQVLGETYDIPGYGKYVSFLDTEGNQCSMLEPKAMTGGGS